MQAQEKRLVEFKKDIESANTIKALSNYVEDFVDYINSEKKLLFILKNDKRVDSWNKLKWLPEYFESKRNKNKKINKKNLKELTKEIETGVAKSIDSLITASSEKAVMEKYTFYFKNVYNFLINNLTELSIENSTGIKKIPEKESLGSISKSVIKMPDSTKWDNICIKWLNGNDVRITLDNEKKFNEIKDYKELGFYDYKRKCPNMLWKILLTAANYDGIMRWNNIEGVTNPKKLKNVDAFQKRISLLRKQLKSIFGLQDDPFVTYSEDKKYVIKMKLVSEKNKACKKKDEIWEDLMSKDEINRYKETEKKIIHK